VTSVTDRDDTIRDLAALVHNALHRYPSPSVRAGRVAKRIGLGEDDSAEAIEAGLREALGATAADRPQGLAGRVTAVLAAAGYTEAGREVFPGGFIMVPLSKCDWVQWARCGCPAGVTLAGEGFAVTEQDAWKEFYERKRDVDRARKSGERMELVTHDRWGAEIMPLMTAPCPHRPAEASAATAAGGAQ